MGIHPFPMLLSLLAAAVPVSASASALQGAAEAGTPTAVPATAGSTAPQPMPELRFQQWLLEANLAQLEQACVDPLIGSTSIRKQQIRDQLLLLQQAPQPFEQLMAAARALLNCGSPDSAAVLLNRISPGAGDQRRQWLSLRWQAAAAALDHRQAALALRRLVNGDLVALASLELVNGRRGLDQLAEHEAAIGRFNAAAAVLLMAPNPARLGQAAEWLAAEDAEQADQLLEQALDQAAADQTWGLAVDLLQLQLRLQLAAGGDGARPRERLERLSARLDDRYTLWQLQGRAEPDPLLRSPREPGGHAAVEDFPDATAPEVPSP